MPVDPFTAGPRPCSACGQRPASVRLQIQRGGQRGDLAVCEPCALRLAERQGGFPAPASRDEREPQSATPALDGFGRDLTAEAAEGRIDPVVGRAEEIEQTVEILARRRKNNAVLIGEAGVGKTAIAEGLALRIAEGDVDPSLEGCRVVALDLAGMVAGSQLRGQFEQRLKTALEEVVASEGKIVLFIDELHTILGAGAAEGAMDAANMLKPMLARGELRMVGATTLAEYRSIERDSALARRFSPVMVEEPSVEETVAILRGLRAAYESHHGVAIADEALEAAARLSDRYVTEYRLPDKAIDLVDQAAARVKLRGEDADANALRARAEALKAEKQAAVDAEAYEDAARIKEEIDALEARIGDQGDAAAAIAGVGETEVAAVIAARTGIPVGELVAGELERLQGLEEDLHRRVIGQEEAVAAVADTVRRARVG